MAGRMLLYERLPTAIVRSRGIAPGRRSCSWRSAVTPDRLQGRRQSSASRRRVRRSAESAPTTSSDSR